MYKPNKYKFHKKYKNISTRKIDPEFGIIDFDSKLEAAVYDIIKLRPATKLLQCQKTIYLTDSRIQYIADFEVLNEWTGEVYYIEAKGMETPSWRIKRKLWIKYGAGSLEIWKGHYEKPYLHETLIVKP